MDMNTQIPLMENLKELFSSYDIINNLTIILAIVLPILFRNFIANAILNRAVFFLEKSNFSKTNIEKFQTKSSKPLSLIGFLISIFIVKSAYNLTDYQTLINNTEKSLLIIIIFWLFHISIGTFSSKLKKMNKVLSSEMFNFFVKLLKILIIFLAVAAVLETWGVKVAPILAGLGLFGVAVALGAQDLFKNLIAGVLVIAEKRFEQGDWIKIDGVVEGTVDNIGFRSTKIVRFDKAPVFVPNTKLSDNVVTNFSRMPQRRILLKFGVLYSTTIEQLRTITDRVHQFIIDDERFNTEELTNFVRIESFNDSSIDIMVYCFTEDTTWVNWLEAREDLICKIKEIVTEEKSDFAFPSRSLYLAEDEKDMLNSFVKTSKKPKTKKQNS